MSVNETPELNGVTLHNYFNSLVNSFYKILPMSENHEETLPSYLEALRDELIGCNSLHSAAHNDPMLLKLVSTLQFLIDTPDCSLVKIRSKVFSCISICNKLKLRYAQESGDAE